MAKEGVVIDETKADTVSCPNCSRDWVWQSEQAVCIDLYEECIVCRFTESGSCVGTYKELQEIGDLADDRKISINQTPMHKQV